MARLYLESWAPGFGSPVEADQSLPPSEVEVDPAVEVDGAWEPLPGLDDGVRSIAFVDGVRRIDARLTVFDADDDSGLPIPGLCASYAVGATVWQRGPAPRSTYEQVAVHRIAVLGRGRAEQMPQVRGLAYATESTEGEDDDQLTAHVQTRMRQAEGACAAVLAQAGHFVVADGPINEFAPQQVIGYIKTHHRSYLGPAEAGCVAALRPGERTPMFRINPQAKFQRYSWYVRLAAVPFGHAWSGVVRCESAFALGRDEARKIADRTAAILPLVAPPLHIDPRAPQNLVPIAALEKHLRHQLGDAALVERALRAALHAPSTSAEQEAAAR
ncbi:MAG: hypothetical protein O2798_10235 [Chloroflexi bacterium]|nr:hypothetical protein [Chloroflexota bacterium]MDA1241200.1 hypothetical protein [Chloroflexota bacterium]